MRTTPPTVCARDKQLEAVVTIFSDPAVSEAATVAKMCQATYGFLNSLAGTLDTEHAIVFEEHDEGPRYDFRVRVTAATSEFRPAGGLDLSFTIVRNGQTTLYHNGRGSYVDWMHTLARHLQGRLRYVDWVNSTFIITVDGILRPNAA